MLNKIKRFFQLCKEFQAKTRELQQTKARLAQTAKEKEHTERTLAQTTKEKEQTEQKLGKVLQEKEAVLTQTAKDKEQTERTLAQTAKEKEQTERTLAQTAKEKEQTERTLAQTAKEKEQTERTLAQTAKDKKQTEHTLAQTAKEKEQTERTLAQTTKDKKQTERTLAQTAKEKEQTERTLAQTAKEKEHTEHTLAQTTKEKEQTEQKLELVSRLVSAQPTNKGLALYKQTLEHDFMQFAATENALKDEAGALKKLQNIQNELELIAAYPQLHTKSVIAVGGGFSAGKSEFISSLFTNTAVKLPVGIQPTTAIPAYVLNSSTNELIGCTPKGGVVNLREIDPQFHEKLSHDFMESFSLNLKEIMPFMILGTKMGYAHTCFIDTPGYNPAGGGHTAPRCASGQRIS